MVVACSVVVIVAVDRIDVVPCGLIVFACALLMLFIVFPVLAVFR
jgi:hypothetical protein